MLGQSISHYKITDKLAPAAWVWCTSAGPEAGAHRRLEILPRNVAVSERDKQSLLREARAASALDHPNNEGATNRDAERVFSVLPLGNEPYYNTRRNLLHEPHQTAARHGR